MLGVPPGSVRGPPPSCFVFGTAEPPENLVSGGSPAGAVSPSPLSPLPLSRVPLPSVVFPVACFVPAPSGFAAPVGGGGPVPLPGGFSFSAFAAAVASLVVVFPSSIANSGGVRC